MAYKSTTINDIRSAYIRSIAEDTHDEKLYIEVGFDEHPRVYEIYRYGKTATSSGGGSGGHLGTTPIYEEGAMWIED